MNSPTVIWTPGDVAAAARLLSQHEAISAAPAELAAVVDITTRKVIA